MPNLIPPLALELQAAIALLRESGYGRAANRLEKMSQDVLAPSRKRAIKHRTIKASVVDRSGRASKIRGGIDAHRVEVNE